MADYWVSTKRWTCPYCDTTINDDIPSRRQHEGGFRHKNNVERSLKDLYRKSETQKRDAEKAKREMAQIEKLAEAAHQADLAAAGASGTTASASSSSSQAGPSALHAATSSRPRAPPPTSTNRFDAYGSTIAEEARRLEAEATAAAQKVAKEEELARKDGIPGEWETVATPTVAAETSSSGLQASTAYPPPSDRSVARNFRLQEKTAASAGDDEDDEGSLSTIKVKKRMKVEPNSAERQRIQEEEARRQLPVWNSMRLGRPGETSSLKKEEVKGEVKEEADGPGSGSSEQTSTATSEARPPAIKAEDPDEAESKPLVDTTAGSNDQQTSNAASISPPPIPPSSGGSGSMFKKRKAGAGAGAKKVRMF